MDIEAERTETARTVANAKRDIFAAECQRWAVLVRRGLAGRVEAVDILVEIGRANFLEDDWVETRVREAMADARFHPLRAEAA
jgi:hypothetical protein